MKQTVEFLNLDVWIVLITLGQLMQLIFLTTAELACTVLSVGCSTVPTISNPLFSLMYCHLPFSVKAIIY